MKRLSLITIIAFFITSCNSSNDRDGQQGHEQTMGMPHTHAMMAGSSPQVDPVCNMPREMGWTDYTMHNMDTLWFCSEGCKKAFMARPGKYLNKTEQ